MYRRITIPLHLVPENKMLFPQVLLTLVNFITAITF